MAGLSETYATLHSMMRGEIEPAIAARALGTDTRRLGIYKNFVRDHVTSVIEKNFSMTCRLLGEAAAPLREAFYLKVPARSWELNHATEQFPDFLQERQKGGDTSIETFAISLARFEWALFETYVDETRVDGSVNAAGQGAPYQVNPTLRALPFNYSLVPWVLAYDAAEAAGEAGVGKASGEPEESEASGAVSAAGAETSSSSGSKATTTALGQLPALPARLEAPEITLLFRHPTKLVSCYWRGSDRLLFALKVVLESIPLEDAAQATNQSVEDCQAALDHARSLGLLV